MAESAATADARPLAARPLRPGPVPHPLQQGQGLYDERRFEEAERELEEAYLLRPRDQKVLNLLGLVYFKQEKLEKAEEVYRKLVAESPEAPTLYYNLGLIYFKLDRLEEAEPAFLKALELDREQPQDQLLPGLDLRAAAALPGRDLPVPPGRREPDGAAGGGQARRGRPAAGRAAAGRARSPDDTAEFKARRSATPSGAWTRWSRPRPSAGEQRARPQTRRASGERRAPWPTGARASPDSDATRALPAVTARTATPAQVLTDTAVPLPRARPQPSGGRRGDRVPRAPSARRAARPGHRRRAGPRSSASSRTT